MIRFIMNTEIIRSSSVLVGLLMGIGPTLAAGNTDTVEFRRGAPNPYTADYHRVEDTMLRYDDGSDLNYGGLDTFTVGADERGSVMKAAIRFDLDLLADHVEELQDAELALAVEAQQGTQGLSLNVRPFPLVMSPWSEGRGKGTLQWDGWPMTGAWRAFQGERWAPRYFNEPLAATVPCSGTDTVVRIALPAALVRQWIEAPSRGVLLALGDEKVAPTNRWIRFHSSEATNSAFRPVLQVRGRFKAPSGARKEMTVDDRQHVPQMKPVAQQEFMTWVTNRYGDVRLPEKWTALLIQGPDAPPEYEADYATTVLKDAWDFDEGDEEGIAFFSPGIEQRRVEDGKLKFHSGLGAFFYWGNPLQHPDKRDEKIGTNWAANHEWAVVIRLRQSLNESLWSCKAQSERNMTVRGTNWQEVTFQMQRHDQPFFPYLIVSTDTPGNYIEIDSIRAVAIVPSKCYRKTFVMEGSPEEGQVFFSGLGNRLYVNGKLAREVERGEPYSLTQDTVDITRFLRTGTNVIGVLTTGGALAEGFVRDNRGRILHLCTDKSWRAYGRRVDGWEQLNFDDSNWPQAWGHQTLDRLQWTHRFGRPFPDFPPHAGAIQLDMPAYAPFFDARQGVDLTVRVPRAPEDPPGHLTWQAEDLTSRQVVASGELDAPRAKGSQFYYRVQWRPPAAGAYWMSFEYRQGTNVVDRRDHVDMAVYGPVDQPTVCDETALAAWMERKTLVDEIDCAEDPPRRVFMDGPIYHSSRVRQTSWGSFREAGEGAAGPRKTFWYAYGFRVRDLYRPHLIVAEVPMESQRWTEVRVGSYLHVSAYPPNGLKAAVVGWSGFPYPMSNGFAEVESVFYPDHPDMHVAIVGPRAACRRIRVYELPGALPYIPLSDKAGRLVGVHTERLGVEEPFHGLGPESELNAPGLLGVVRPMMNHIRYMRFRGENLFDQGVYMYRLPQYPESRFTTRGSTLDAVELRARFFEANGLSLLLNTEFSTSKALQNALMYTDDDVAAGAPTLLAVDRFGRQRQSGFTGFNILHPKVQSELVALAEEIADRYGRLPAIKGLLVVGNFFLLPAYLNGEDPPEVSYDDITIAQFQEETGLKIPVDLTDRARFGKRYDWIVKNVREPWVRWRCEKMADLHRRLADAVKRQAPSWQYYLSVTIGFPCSQTAAALRTGRPVAQPTELLRAAGFDLALLGHLAPAVKIVLAPGAERPSQDKFQAIGNQAVCASPDMGRAWQALPGAGAWVGESFEEWETVVPEGQTWYWSMGAGYYANRSYSCAYPAPLGPAIRNELLQALLHADPPLMLYSWTDVDPHTGYERELGKSFRFFRSLPRDDYRPVAGCGPEDDIVVRSGRRTAYVANPNGWPVRVKAGREEFPLEAYGVRLLERPVKSGTSVTWVHDAAAAAFVKRIWQTAAAQPAGEAEERYRTALGQVRQALEDGRIRAAWQGLLSWDVARRFNACEVSPQ